MRVRDPRKLRSGAQRSAIDGIVGALRGIMEYETVTASITMSAETPALILSTPSAAYTQALPTTNVAKGQPFTFKNLSSTAGRNITINSSGGNLVWLVCPGNECTVVALQDTPTTAAHWTLLNRGWPIIARVHKSADQTNITESAIFYVTFNTVLQDPASMFDDANDQLVLPLPGLWEVDASIMYEGDTFLAPRASIYFNGAHVAGSDAWGIQDAAGDSTVYTGKLKALIECTVPGTDQVRLNSWYTAAGANIGDVAEASALYVNAKSTWLSAKYVGPSLGGP